VWAAKIQENIEAYEAELANKVGDLHYVNRPGIDSIQI
jgi:hypothetical protein